jgi:hypothetical protein
MSNRITAKRFLILILLVLFPAGARAQMPVVSYHPRIWLTPQKLAVLKARAQAGTPQWKRLLFHLDNSYTWYRETTLAMSASLAYLCLRDTDPTRAQTYADLAIQKALTVVGRGVPQDLDNYKVSVTGVAVTFDWLYDVLTPQQKQQIIDFVNQAYDDMAEWYEFAWMNYNYDIMMITGISGYATYGDNPRAQELIDYIRNYRWGFTKPALEFTGKGGGWAEENGYAMEITSRLVRWMAAVKSATGEDLFRSIDFVHDRLLYELLSMYPRAWDYYGKYYHGHIPTGDGRQGIGPWQYARIGRLITIEALSNTDYAKYAQAWVSRPPADKMAEDWMSMWDFLFYNPSQDSLPLDQAPLACYAEGTGTVVMKGDWTADGTLIHFQGGGPHLEYHQHLDKNSFVIHKRNGLAIDSGTYDGMGDYEDHVINYYKRTIAHNSILVYDPNETATWEHTWQYKPAVNDGGQRAMSIYTQSGSLVGVWVPFNSTGMDWGQWAYNKYRINFDCGSTPRFEHTTEYTYTMGDATKAYPQWRVTNFTRQLVYLRPLSQGGDEFVVVFDRISSTNPDWQKYWLLHFLKEPVVLNGSETQTAPGIWEYTGADLVSVENGGGKLFCKTLLPLNPKIRKIGGELTYDSWVFGANHEYVDECCYGWGRMEVLPTTPQNDDLFLHVLYPTFAGTPSMPVAERVDGTNVVGAKVAGRVTMFSRTEQTLDGGDFKIGGTGLYKFLLFDLVPGEPFDVFKDGELVYSGRSSKNTVLGFEIELNGRHRMEFRKAARVADVRR